MMENSRLSTSEAIAIILSVFVAHTLVALPRTLIESTKSATIINLIYVTLIAVIIAIIIFRLLKNFPGYDIIDISEFLGGKFFKKFVGMIFIAYFIISGGILLRNFCECLNIVYYPMTNIIFILLLFVIIICLATKYKLSSISKVNLLIIPLVVLSIIFLFIANYDNFSFDNIFPLLGDGYYETFIYGLGNLGAFGGITLLYFLPPYLKEPKKSKKIFTFSILLGGLYIILCVSIILFMFISLIYTNQIMPLYTAARYIEFGTFFQRLESIFLLIWIFEMVTYLCILTKFAHLTCKKIFNTKNDKPTIWILGLLIFLVSYLPQNYAVSKFIEDYVYKYMMIIVSIIFSLIILFLACFKKRIKKVNQ